MSTQEYSVVLLHDNGLWTRPLVRALRQAGVKSLRLVHVIEDWSPARDASGVDWSLVKIVINRVSPSHVRRGNLSAIPHTNQLLAHIRDVTRGNVVELGTGNAWELELSKWRQYQAGTITGLPVLPSLPISRAEADQLTSSSFLTTRLKECFGGPAAANALLIKPEIGGSGFGLDKVNNDFALDQSDEDAAEKLEVLLAKIRKVVLQTGSGGAIIQEFVPGKAGEPAPAVFRYEFIRDRLMYVLRISPDPQKGDKQFDNCPADVCEVKPEQQQQPPQQKAEDLCTISHGTDSRFSIVAKTEDEVPHPQLLEAMKNYTRHAGSFVCGIEVIEMPNGSPVVIDCNSVNTNYNESAETRAEVAVEATPVHLMAAEIALLLERSVVRQKVIEFHKPIVQSTLARMFNM